MGRRSSAATWPAINALAVSVSPARRSRAAPWRSAEIADSSAGCRLTDARVSETDGRIMLRCWRVGRGVLGRCAPALRIFSTRLVVEYPWRQRNRNHAAARGLDFFAPGDLVQRPVRAFDENVRKHAGDQFARSGLIENGHVIHRRKRGQHFGAILLRHQRTFGALVSANAAIAIDGDDQHIAEARALRARHRT